MPGNATRTRTTTRPMTATQRQKLATQQMLDTLQTTDKALAMTAALEVLNEWLTWDSSIRKRLSEIYQDLAILATKKQQGDLGPKPVPISGPDLDHYNPYAQPDPYKLLEWYGHDQFRAVMMRATQKQLRDMVNIVQARNDGTKPVSRSLKLDMVNYLVELVAGPDY